MAHPSRRKGHRFEREIVREAEAKGLEAAEQVDLLFDTAESKKTRGDDPGRPTDPTLRCLGMTEDRFQALRRRVKDAQAEQDVDTDVSVTH